jgi:hypothetical protein
VALPDGGGGGLSLPDWISDLRVLAPVAATLATLATNPVQWLRGPFLQLAVEHVILRPAAWVLEYVIQGFEIAADAVGTATEPLGDVFRIPADAVVAAVTGLYDLVYLSAAGTGLAAPIATVVTVGVVVVVVFSVLYALASVIPGSDAVGGLTRWT